MIGLAAEKNSANILRMHAERNPDIQDILLQKAKFQEMKHVSVTDKEEFKKILNQVDTVLSEVEKELESHTEGMRSKAVSSCEHLLATHCSVLVALIFIRLAKYCIIFQ